MNESLKSLLFFTFRVLIYAAVMILLNLIYTHDAGTVTASTKFGRTPGLKSCRRFSLPAGTDLLVHRQAQSGDGSPEPASGPLFFFMAFIRRFNNQIDYWFYLVLPLLLLFGWLAFRDRKKLVAAAVAFVEMPVTAYFVTGFLVTFVFSRLFGRTSSGPPSWRTTTNAGPRMPPRKALNCSDMPSFSSPA